MKSAEEVMIIVGAVVFGLIVLTVTIRSFDPRETGEAKAFEIANTIALYVNELSAVQEGNARLQFDSEYDVGLGNNKGAGVWLKQAVTPSFFEEYWLKKLDQQRPQGVYVIVGKKAGKEQYAYVASYSFFTGSLPVPQLGKGSAICIEKKRGAAIAAVSLC